MFTCSQVRGLDVIDWWIGAVGNFAPKTQFQSMREAAQQATMTVEEYIQYELTAEHRHEFINGQLFEMPGEKDVNNEMALEISFLLRSLKTGGFFIYVEGLKVAIPGGEKYYYPMCLSRRRRRLPLTAILSANPNLL